MQNTHRVRRKRKNKVKRIIRRLSTLAAMAIIGCSVFWGYKTIHNIDKYKGGMDKVYAAGDEITEWVDHADLYSHYATLVRIDDNKVLYEKNGEERMYPASMTKVMTAIVAIENITDLEQTVVLPDQIFQEMYSEGASLAGFLPGEEVTAIDLLYGTMLPSGGESAEGLALMAAGSQEQFVDLMNQKAEQLGMKDTHYENVSGLHNDNHYTTAKDMTILLEYALKNETFKEIFTSSRHTTQATNLHPDGFTMRSTLFSKMDSGQLEGGEILGGKTGYTSDAGLCLASYAQKDGKDYILVTAGADGNTHTEQYNIMDAFTVYNDIK